MAARYFFAQAGKRVILLRSFSRLAAVKPFRISRLEKGEVTGEEWLQLEAQLTGQRLLVTGGVHELWNLLTTWGAPADVRFNLRCHDFAVEACALESRDSVMVFEYRTRSVG
jgi:hypothetical protein